MVRIIKFANARGLTLHEWKDTRRRTCLLVGVGFLMRVLSTVIVGCGNYLETLRGMHRLPREPGGGTRLGRMPRR